MKANRALLLLAVLAVVGVAVALWAQSTAFPVASVEFKVDRQQAGQMARSYLQDAGFDLSAYQEAISFETDGNAQSYVERKLGLSRLNQLSRGEISVWHWRVRFFRELQEEEFAVLIDPIGRIVGLSHHVPEASSGASLSSEEARGVAERFLSATLGIDLSHYTLISTGQEKRPNRLDHSFTWERAGFKVAEADYRLYATVQGDQVDSYSEGLRVPEEWLREQAKESSRGAVLNAVGWAVTYGFGGVLLVLFLLDMRAGRVRWRFVITLAVALLIVLIVAGINSTPLLLIGYPTTSTLAAYIWDQTQRYVSTLLPEGVLLVLAGAVGAGLWLRLFPTKPSLHLLLTGRGLRSISFVRSIVAGYLMAGVWLGYVSFFYWLGITYLGVWSPVETPYQDIMSTLLPAVYPLTVGAGAAINEELFFRLFAVPLLLLAGGIVLARLGWARGRPPRAGSLTVVLVALIVPAATWATLHTTYPQQPFYIRAIEVGIVGVGQGLLLLRFGVLTTITAHYTYNAIIVGWLFILSGLPYLQVSAVLVPLLPALLLVPAAVARVRRQRLARDEEMTETQIEHAAAPPMSAPPAPTAVPESPTRAVWLGLAVAAAIGMLAGLFLHQDGLTAGLRLSTTRATAEQLADGYLPRLGIPADGWTRIIQFVDWSLGSDTAYVMRQLGTREAGRFLTRELRPYTWEVRYVKPLEKEEVRLTLDPSGELWGMAHALPEAEPGAQLTEGQARTTAEAIAGRMPGLDLSQYAPVSYTARKQDARIDHTFVWERQDLSPKATDGSLRLLVTVSGDIAGRLTRFFKTPEFFDRQRAEQTALDAAIGVARSLVGLALAAAALVLFVVRFRRYDIDLRLALTMGAVVVVLLVLAQLNQLPVFLANYVNTLSISDYAVRRVTDILVALGLQFGQTVIVVGVVETLYRERFPVLRPIRAQIESLRDGPAAFRREVVLLGASLVALLWGGSAIYHWARERWASGTLVPEAEVPTTVLNSLLPALESLLRGASSAITLTFLGAVVVLLTWKYVGRWTPIVLPLVVALLLTGGAANLNELWPLALALIVGVALGLLFYRYAAGPRILCYAFAVYSVFLLQDGLFLMRQPETFYVLNGLAAILLVVLPALWLIRPAHSQTLK